MPISSFRAVKGLAILLLRDMALQYSKNYDLYRMMTSNDVKYVVLMWLVLVDYSFFRSWLYSEEQCLVLFDSNETTI